MSETPADLRQRMVRRHLRIGWWGLLVFLCLGIALDAMHGWKFGGYLDPPSRWRRELWRLAHFHGTLLSLVHIGFACTLPRFGAWTDRRLKLASFFLLDALLLLPLGFFLGGIGHSETDPSPGVLLVPLGALTLLIAVALIVWSVTFSASAEKKEAGEPTEAP